MTAEVAILNKSAVALAADSAITIGNQKIYNSGNKLFALSKYRPVGIMIFGNAEFMEVPWETIIKYYRSVLKTKKFNKLIDYAEDFKDFIQNEKSLFWPIEEQKKHFQEVVSSYFSVIVNEINEKVSVELDKKPLSEEQISIIVYDIIKIHHDKCNSYQDLFEDCSQFVSDVMESHEKVTNEIILNIFQELPIIPEGIKFLNEISSLIFCKNMFSENSSGIVIAGFGEEEIFPSAVEYRLESIISERLKFYQNRYIQSTREHDAIILPFAQHEMVTTFVEGIDPMYNRYLNGYFKELLMKYPENILAAIPGIKENKKEDLQELLRNLGLKIFEDFQDKNTQYRDIYHISPVLQAVSVLPKDELASMAESLVNLTSFKRKVSLQAETVGGPIDVAVISKGDGFVWIKRKHYFKPELNQVFLTNYYREEE